MTATAAAGSCTGPGRGPGGPGPDAEVCGLVAALLEAVAAAALLAARYRAHAVASREPAVYVSAAAVTGAAQALGQARGLVCGGMPPVGGPAGPSGEPLVPAGAPQESAQLLAGARLLEGAVSALARRSAAAGRQAAQPLAGCLGSVHACLRAALEQLAGAREPGAATTAGQDHAGTGDPARDPGTCWHGPGRAPGGCAR